MVKTFKTIALVLLVLISMSLIALLLQKNRSNQDAISPSENKVDRFLELQASNPLYQKGQLASMSGDYEQSIDLFEKSKQETSSDSERAIIDFSIAASRFNLNRISGINDFITLSKNESYPDRTRGLAMVRSYLMYSKYNDQGILVKLATEYGIPWGRKSNVVYLYMKKVYNIYPFAYPAIMIVNYEIFNVKTKEEALAIYTPYAQVIDIDIAEMKNYSGEVLELTSTMLAKARLLSFLNLRFNAIPKEEVEKAYEDLINYSQTKNLTVNMQYTLLSYIDYESRAKDYTKADQIIAILTSSTIDPSVKESLSKTSTSTYPYLYSLLESRKTDKKVIDLALLIGSAIKK